MKRCESRLLTKAVLPVTPRGLVSTTEGTCAGTGIIRFASCVSNQSETGLALLASPHGASFGPFLRPPMCSSSRCWGG